MEQFGVACLFESSGGPSATLTAVFRDADTELDGNFGELTVRSPDPMVDVPISDLPDTLHGVSWTVTVTEAAHRRVGEQFRVQDMEEDGEGIVRMHLHGSPPE